MLLLLSLAFAAPKRPPPPDPDATAITLRDAALASDEAWAELVTLADTIGPRLTGSPAYDAAVAWASREMEADGLTVRTEPVTAPRWRRGEAELVQLHPLSDRLDLLALGDSGTTGPEGLEADVLVVSSFDELAARAADAKGRIVVWDVPFTTYGETGRYRWAGASKASEAGAVASLVRSITTESLDTPHTGGQRFADGVTPIPAAAITVEDAARLHRLQDRGVTPRLRLTLTPRRDGEVTVHNVVGELRGRNKPEEIVVLGCHLDSWDVGQGAQDDGAGCVTVMAAGALLASLPQAPRRTVRVVLYANEENGLAGGKGYGAAHVGERIVAAVEDDTGAGTPLGFDVESPTAEALIASLSTLRGWLDPLGAGDLSPGGSGADISPLVARGVPGFGLRHDMTGYWPIHHTDADTIDKIDPALVRRNVAAVALLAWALAETADLPAVPLPAQPTGDPR